MKLKKWMIVTGIILLSFALSGDRIDELFQLMFRNLDLQSKIIAVPLMLIVTTIYGLLKILRDLWEFLLSWEGVLFLAVILSYLTVRIWKRGDGSSASEREVYEK